MTRGQILEPLALGRNPSAELPRFQFADLLEQAPAVPADFGHDRMVHSWQGVCGNDRYGCCVQAMGAKAQVLWGAEAGRPIRVSPSSVLADYHEVTGWTPEDTSSDRGTDMAAYYAWWRKHGVRDATGKRHRIGAYVNVDPKDHDHLAAATYLLGCVGLGIAVTQDAMDQFRAGQPWTPTGDTRVLGGHAILLAGRHQGDWIVITWGKAIRATPGFLDAYLSESIGAVSRDALTGGRSLEGFNVAQLNQMLAALRL